MKKLNITFLSALLLVSLSITLLSCSKDEPLIQEIPVEAEDEKDDEEVEEEEEEQEVGMYDFSNVEPKDIVSINSESSLGLFYNFWSTRPMINQNRFNASGFRNSLNPLRSYVKSYNLVRTMGGRTDNQNEFYKGVDESGNIITDFTELISTMRNFRSTGFKPRIVLSKVPWEMVDEKIVNTYGNTNPPNDYNLWRKYVNAFLTALVNEFGMNEVKTWRFRVSTEPNYSPNHWNGTVQEYFKHYDITVDEVLKVIPEAIVGPGNLLTEGAVGKFSTEIIDHCANGTNYATGQKGTQMDFFALSYYEKLDKKELRFEKVVKPYRDKLNSYPQFSNIPFDIHEFGILRGDNGKRGLSLSDATELGASWYATIADLAYKYNVTEIYDWGQELEGSDLPTGRRSVTEMMLKLEGGMRLFAEDELSGFSGVIPVSKNGKLYMLIYNHNTTRNSTNSKTIYPKFDGSQISSNTTWKLNEWTIDKENSVLMHELYKDIKAAGIGEKTNGRIYGNRPSDRFEDGWKNILSNNLSKYQQLSKLSLTIKDSLIGKFEDNLMLKVDLAPHSVKLIELTPQ